MIDILWRVGWGSIWDHVRRVCGGDGNGVGVSGWSDDEVRERARAREYSIGCTGCVSRKRTESERKPEREPERKREGELEPEREQERESPSWSVSKRARESESWSESPLKL